MSTRLPNFSALEAGALLALHFPASDATQGLTILGQFVPVARSRRSLARAMRKYGLTLTEGTVDGEAAEAAITFATEEMIQLAFIPQGLSTVIAIQHGTDYLAAYEIASLLFDGKIRPLG